MIRRVGVGISGGVDSAVAAHLIKSKGFDVVGVHMKNWDGSEETGSDCSNEEDQRSAAQVCETLQIPLLPANFIKNYWNDVFQALLDSYKGGRRINVDILCNQFVKFDSFYKYCLNELGVDAIATGHYARNSWGNYLEKQNDQKEAALFRPSDFHKDQTHFLSRIPQAALRKTMFPLADMLKDEVKRLASQIGLSNQSRRKESKGICFIGKRKFSTFIDDYIDPTPGKFIQLETGEEIGTHTGIHHFTIGQNVKLKGLRDKLFVCHMDVQSQEIYVCERCNGALYAKGLDTDIPYWISGRPPIQLFQRQKFRCRVLIQNATEPQPANLWLKPKTGGLAVEFYNPLRSVAPGQTTTFYWDDQCLGCAEVAEVDNFVKIS